LKAKFEQLAPVLIRMGVLTSLDADGLARYLIAESNYLRATNRLTSAMNTGNTVEADKWSAIQDRFFRQCRAAGSDLGLTVSGRCSLELPPGYEAEEAPGEEADLFGDG
jgi:P27 family predicted phage terminase small subunit